MKCEKCGAELVRPRATSFNFMRCPKCGTKNFFSKSEPSHPDTTRQPSRSAAPVKPSPRATRTRRFSFDDTPSNDRQPKPKHNTASSPSASSASRHAAPTDSQARSPQNVQLKTCAKCAKELLGNAEYYDECEKAGFAVDRVAGTVQIVIKNPGDVLGAHRQRKTLEAVKAQLDNRRAVKCMSCKTVYCLECIQKQGLEDDGGKHDLTCLKCGGRCEYASSAAIVQSQFRSQTSGMPIPESQSAKYVYQCSNCGRKQEYWKNPAQKVVCKYCNHEMARVK